MLDRHAAQGLHLRRLFENSVRTRPTWRCNVEQLAFIRALAGFQQKRSCRASAPEQRGVTSLDLGHRRNGRAELGWEVSMKDLVSPRECRPIHNFGIVRMFSNQGMATMTHILPAAREPQETRLIEPGPFNLKTRATAREGAVDGVKGRTNGIRILRRAK